MHDTHVLQLGPANLPALPCHFQQQIASTSCWLLHADGVASDTVVSQSNEDFPKAAGTETKPCGYPLLNGDI